MASRRFLRSLRVPALALFCLSAVSFLQAQGATQTVPQNPIPDSDADHVQERDEWFFRGRLVRGKPSADLHRSSGGSAPPVTPPPSGTQPVTYQITVTGASPGTAPDASHSTVMTLVVE